MSVASGALARKGQWKEFEAAAGEAAKEDHCAGSGMVSRTVRPARRKGVGWWAWCRARRCAMRAPRSWPTRMMGGGVWLGGEQGGERFEDGEADGEFVVGCLRGR